MFEGTEVEMSSWIIFGVVIIGCLILIAVISLIEKNTINGSSARVRRSFWKMQTNVPVRSSTKKSRRSLWSVRFTRWRTERLPSTPPTESSTK
jgi:hypothetical protein